MCPKKTDDNRINQRVHSRPVRSPRRHLQDLAPLILFCISALAVAIKLTLFTDDLSFVPQPSQPATSTVTMNQNNQNNQINNNQAINPPPPSIFHPPSQSALRKNRALLDATRAMKCLILPGCYPDVPCGDDTPPMKLPQGKTWEQHSFCTGDLKKKVASIADNNNSKCLVYSFGVHDSTDWESKMARVFGCDVYAFDPTSKFETGTELAPGVTFHKLGLQGAGVDVSTTHSALYDAIDPEKLRTLSDIREMLGHEQRQVDVLRLDCEGCEWGVLKQLACSDDSALVDQLMVELHFQKNLGIATDEDLLIAADAIACLEEKKWGLTSMEFSGCDPLDADYVPRMNTIIKEELRYMLLFATFRRVPMEKPLYKKNDPTFAERFTKREVYHMAGHFSIETQKQK